MNKVILVLFLLITLIPIGCNEQTQETVDAQDKVYAFLMDMNPDLYRAMLKMREEVTLADKNIQKLYELKGMYPDQRNMINKSIKQWQSLRKTLNKTLRDIHDKIEKAYVVYRIDDIQGKYNFGMIAGDLLKEANTVLANAIATKSLIEEELRKPK
jgi:hypothetical protein